jgi:hypothetical protein
LVDFLLDIQWRPQIGDPSFVGWLTTFAYVATALLAGWIVLRSAAYFPDEERTGSRRLWMGFVLLMILLGFNKQLDLQSLFTEFGQILAHQQGWYDERRSFQVWFVLGLATLGLLAFLALAWRGRRQLRSRLLLLFGVALLLTFILVRAATFHHFDRFLQTPLVGWRANWVLELSGIACIALQAIFEIRNGTRDESSFRNRSRKTR